MTQAYPLQWPIGWPRAKTRKRAKFSVGERQYSREGSGSWMTHKDLSIAMAMKRVLDELGRFGVPYGGSVISTNLELRLDGLPRSNQGAPQDPGVAVYWRKSGEEMKVMAIDIYDRVTDNLAAVAATLSAMRAIERHGGAQVLERAFTGFGALPPPRTCWAVLGVPPRAPADVVNSAFRRLAAEHHPDRGGSHDRMSEISQARDAALKALKALEAA